MTKVLIFGAGGMLGHKLVERWASKYAVTATVRKPQEAYSRYGLYSSVDLIGGVDVEDLGLVESIVCDAKPDFVVNCVGVIKQLEAARDPVLTITLNSLFPHRVARMCRANDARLVHISTDCVFSGNRGMYHESDIPDPEDLYGRTKLLGEVTGPNCLTLRTSIIGRELDTQHGLIEWFLHAKKPEVSGYRQAIYSGLTTIELARVLESVIDSGAELGGLYHVSAEPIGKYELLHLVRKTFGVPTAIAPVDSPVIDRSLDSARFRTEMHYLPPSWPEMIEELSRDVAAYMGPRT